MNCFLKLCNSVRRRYLKAVTIYDDPEVNRIFWHFSVLGGIVTTKKIKPTFKKVWLVVNTSTMLIILSMNVLSYIWYAEKNFPTMLKLSQPLLPILAASSSWITFATFRKNMEIFSEDADIFIKNSIFDEDISDIRAKITLSETLMGTLPTSLFIIEVMRKYFLSDFRFLGEISSFFYPFADKFQTNSTTISIAVLFLQFLTTLPLSLNCFCTLHLLQMFIKLEHRLYEISQKQIQTISLSTIQQLESSHNEEFSIEQEDIGERNRLAKAFVADRDRISDNFGKELKYWFTRCHQQEKMVHTLYPMFEMVSSLFVFSMHVVQIPLGEQIISVIYDPSQFSIGNFYAFCFFFLNTYVLYQICYIGKKINQYVEQGLMDLYSTPWYMLSKKHRRDIYIFSTVASSSQGPRVFLTKPIGMPLFSDLLDSWYSNICTLRELVMKVKK